MRSDQEQVNSDYYYKLLTTNTESSVTKAGTHTGYVGSKVAKYSNGVKTYISGDNCIAIVTGITSTPTQKSANWNCPETNLNTNDRIIVEVYTCYSDGTPVTLLAQFITEILGASKLNNATWTFYYWLRRSPYSPYPTMFLYGSSTYNSRITNFTWTQAVVIGKLAYTTEPTTGWNKLRYATEPPTTGWNKLLYEGET